MASILGRLVEINVRMSRGFDRLLPFPPRSRGSLGDHEPRTMFVAARNIGDVGGGKKPYALAVGLDLAGKVYVGLDLDPEELSRAPTGTYTQTAVLDICAPEGQFARSFDLIICRNTLEHVTDAEAAIRGLASLLAEGGHCFVKLPCRRAVFAQLNLLLPNEMKRKLMHAVFPKKKGDGFPAFYHRGTPSELHAIAQVAGLEVVAEKRNYWSSYFSFLFPLYLLWRGIATVQYLMDPDYCESFEMVLHKPMTR